MIWSRVEDQLDIHGKVLYYSLRQEVKGELTGFYLPRSFQAAKQDLFQSMRATSI